ncbi:MAG: Hsp20/alpha crystallin family protein [Bacteroidetes bacterium]|nr:Hsp20/alpha crystallin family protein [Bacteroidota bacterium]
MNTITKQGYKPFSDLFDELFTGLPSFERKTRNGIIPSVNIHETIDAYHIELVAPGLKKEDFKVNVEKGILTISFENHTENEKNDYKTLLKEFTQFNFKRSFNIEDKINVDGIEALYESGILKLFLPKKEELKVVPKEILIK